MSQYFVGPSIGGELTGRYLVVLDPNDEHRLATVVESADTGVLAEVVSGRRIVHSHEFGTEAVPDEVLAADGAVVFDTIGVAVVSADAEEVRAATSAAGSPQVAMEPERWRFALPDTAEYVRGFRDAAQAVFDGCGDASGDPRPGVAAAPRLTDTATATWGVQAVGAVNSVADGVGIQVAVLDTGLADGHPDFLGRLSASQSFVPGEDVDDLHGHGTHCCGTVAGPTAPSSGRRYGVAPNVSLFAGKVLGNDGRGADGWILAGIDWALRSGCQVVSMSLGSDVPTVSAAYDAVGRRALRAGALIVAAAGNNARRPASPGFVGQPANAPSIMAVGAVDQRLVIGSFSASSGPPPGGQIDIAGPGVDVYSAAPGGGYRIMSGTSMATPHVAGLAALHAQRTGLRGLALWGELVRSARRIGPSSLDVGAGLAYAP